MRAGMKEMNRRVTVPGMMGVLFLSALLPVAAQAGEGGRCVVVNEAEALEADAAEDSARSYYTELAIMLGRLQTGHDLYRIGERSMGATHFVALAEEHLPLVREALTERGLDLTVRRVEQLADRAQRSDSWIDVQDMYEATRMSLQRAITKVDHSKRQDFQFKARIVLELAREAVRCHQAAIEAGEIVDRTAYEAGYGLIRFSRSLIERNSGLLQQGGEAAHETLVERHRALETAWPSIRSPSEPVIAEAELKERLRALEDAIEKF